MDAHSLDESLGVGDVSRAKRSAAEGLIMGRGTARVHVLRLGGPMVCKARKNAADAHDGGDVFMYRDSSIALLLDFGRRFKAVKDVLDAMIHDGISLAQSVELTLQWDEILGVGLVNPITLEDFQSAGGGDLCEVRRVTGDLHCWVSDFIHRVFVHRRDDAIRGRRNWQREDPLVHPYKWLWPDVVLLLLFSSVSHI